MLNYKLTGRPLIAQIFNDIFNTNFSDKPATGGFAILNGVDGYNDQLKLAYIYYGTDDYHPNNFMSYRFNSDVCKKFTDTVIIKNNVKIIIIPYHAANYLNYILNRLLITGRGDATLFEKRG